MPAPTKNSVQNVVLVHGGFVDGSGWEAVHRALRKRVYSKEALVALQEPILVLFVTGYLYLAVSQWKMPIGSVLVLIYLFVQVIRGLNKSQRKYQLMISDGSALWSIRAMIDQANAQAEPKGGSAQPSPGFAACVAAAAYSTSSARMP